MTRWAKVVATALLCLVSLGSAASPVAAQNPAGAFEWPLSPRPRVVTAFDPPSERWLPGHRGVDLSTDPGRTVLASGDGVVVFAGTVADKQVISIEHAGGLRTTYEPVESTVSAGDRVRSGQPIGVVVAGHPGCPDRACLHWGLRRGRDYLDPTALVDRHRVRLKPVVG